MARFLLVLLLLQFFHATLSAQKHFLFYTHQGDRTRGIDPGFYGGPVSTSENGTSIDLYWTGYKCANTKEGRIDKFKVKSMSHDPVSRQVLLQLEPGFIVFKADPWKPVQTCDAITSGLDLVFYDVKYSEKIGPFAFYDDEIYYLKHVIENDINHEAIELRKVTGCDASFPVTEDVASYLSECTTTIATLATRTFKHYVVLEPLSLHIYNENGRLRMLAQIQEAIGSDEGTSIAYLNISLLGIDNDGKVDKLHESKASKEYATTIFSHMGGISSRNGKLCWSALTQVFCADFDGRSLEGVQTVIEEGGTSDICAGAGSSFSNLISGVAISRTSPQLELYLGCMANSDGRGGAGLVRLSSQATTIEKFTLKSAGQPVLMGSLFTTDLCPADQFSSVIGGAALPTGSVLIINSLLLSVYAMM